MQIFRREVDSDTHIIVTYQLWSDRSLHDAAWDLAVGQSVGNPNVRNEWETDELFETHACKILGHKDDLADRSYGYVDIAFPIANLDLKCDGVSQLLCMIMGGQLDIDHIKGCRVTNIRFPESIIPAEHGVGSIPKSNAYFKGPQFGIDGIKQFTGVCDKPVLGGIIKPKTGMPPDKLLDMVKMMVDGGVNFIKEDEIMANPACCPINVRVPLIMNYLRDKNVIYAVCINGDPPHVIKRARNIAKMGGNAVHVNFWSGFGTYQALRNENLPLFVHFQKSGDRILTHADHMYGIDWNVICKLAALMGVDFIHAGMWGGYMSNDEIALKQTLDVLQKYGTMPALSCGMHPGLVESIVERFGNNIMLNVGGAIHGHPDGSRAGAQAMRDAIDGIDSDAYRKAIAKWGKK